MTLLSLIHVCMYMYVCMYVCMYVYVCTYVIMYVCMYVCMYVSELNVSHTRFTVSCVMLAVVCIGYTHPH